MNDKAAAAAAGGGGTPTKEAKEGRKGILDAIRLPLSSVFSRKKKVIALSNERF